MSIEIARKILDQVKDGSNEYSTFVITEALKATGDYAEIYEMSNAPTLRKIAAQQKRIDDMATAQRVGADVLRQRQKPSATLG